MNKNTIATAISKFLLVGFSIIILLAALIDRLVINSDGESSLTFILIIVSLIITLIVFLILSFVKNKKMITLAPMLLILLFVRMFDNSSINDYFAALSGEYSLMTSRYLLSLFLLSALVVGIIFALKGKRWAAILSVVIFSINLASSINLFFSMINLNESSLFANNIGYMVLVELAIVLIYTMLIVNFVPIIKNKSEEQI
ncbi:MAG: hypothetical protein J1F31_02905 [Erysipelotrichales bacterium]|nr:hypothetical protein [Erysipelotrichales bacterium]